MGHQPDDCAFFNAMNGSRPAASKIKGIMRNLRRHFDGKMESGKDDATYTLAIDILGEIS